MLVEAGGVFATGDGLLGTDVLVYTQTVSVHGVQVLVAVADEILVIVFYLTRVRSTEQLSLAIFADILRTVVAKEACRFVGDCLVSITVLLLT